ncbi:MAG: DCC1-like thiol-disulfide oxidoreductase family protein [Chthoniobacterales bacterium]
MISELTEITERPEAVPFRGWIFFDEDCSFCRDLALRFEPLFGKRGFHFEPLQRDWVQQRLNLTPEQALEEMRVLTADGRVFGGADAVIFLARQLWWAVPFATIAQVPSIQALLDRGYRWVAGQRTCAINRSLTPSIPVRTRWLGLVILPLLALATKTVLPAWGFMWAVAFAIFFGCKWLTLGNALRRSSGACPFRATAYVLAWPGMDVTRFLSPDFAPGVPGSTVWKNIVVPIVRTLIGAFLLFASARRAHDPILAGWIGMVGMILILHFGLFALLSVGWRALRVDARPIMDAPLRSTSVAEFWGRRWNGAFNDLALGLVFRPLARRMGVVGATLSAFGVSGLIHELVISLPAGAGFGLPTGYFVLQALAILAQRKWAALRGDISGWLFTMIVVTGPAYWLFHPPFVRNVILPFMHAIGAL